MSRVLGVFSAKDGDGGLPRPSVDKLTLIKEDGIEGDKFFKKDAKKAVMVVGKESYDIIKEVENIDLIYGSLGENILFDFDPHNYEVGDSFMIGEAIITIEEKCTICKHLSKFGKNIPKIIKDKRGLYCRVANSGIVKKGDEVKILTKKGAN